MKAVVRPALERRSRSSSCCWAGMPRRRPDAAGFFVTSARYANAFLTRSADIGRLRKRFPVSWKSALAIAGATVTTPISPMPVGALSVITILVWISGTSLMRSTR